MGKKHLSVVVVWWVCVRNAVKDNEWTVLRLIKHDVNKIRHLTELLTVVRLLLYNNNNNLKKGWILTFLTATARTYNNGLTAGLTLSCFVYYPFTKWTLVRNKAIIHDKTSQ